MHSMPSHFFLQNSILIRTLISLVSNISKQDQLAKMRCGGDAGLVWCSVSKSAMFHHPETLSINLHVTDSFIQITSFPIVSITKTQFTQPIAVHKTPLPNFATKLSHTHPDPVYPRYRLWMVVPSKHYKNTEIKLTGNIVNDNSDSGVPDVWRYEGAEPLLTSGVPELQSHRTVFQVHRLRQEVDTDCCLWKIHTLGIPSLFINSW